MTNYTKFLTCHYDPCHNILISPGYSKSKKFCNKECSKLSKMEWVLCNNPACSIRFQCYKSENRKYCSSSCAATVSNSVTPRRTKELNGSCTRCQDPIPSIRKYCDECWVSRSIWNTETRANAWILGDPEVATSSLGSLLPWARDYLLESVGNMCQDCGWCTPNPVLGRPILTIDHVDGNWQNNSYDNLKVLCYNCHTLTPTFGSLNVGNSPAPRPGLYRVLAAQDGPVIE